MSSRQRDRKRRGTKRERKRERKTQGGASTRDKERKKGKTIRQKKSSQWL